MNAFRTPALKWILAAGAALVAAAVPASAALGLPIALPSSGQHVDTPVGSTDLSASEQGIDTCNGVATPALPALPAAPALPVPLPVPTPALPALPTPSASTNACVHAGLDGASASIDGDAAGHPIGAGAQADSPVDAEKAVGDAQSAASAAQGFFEGLVDTLFGWI
jgi:hypothetical protein